ncbi:MAG: PDZ domain-containing protein [Persephonella sp.]|nr:PDZ domain-containing protein [Persephonella sp.]
MQPLTPELAKHFGVKKGVLVSQVMKDGPAAKAGIKSGDIIVAVNDKPVSKISQLQKYVMRNPPGTKIKITIVRNGQKKDIFVTTTSWDGEEVTPANMQDMEAKYGIIVKDINSRPCGKIQSHPKCLMVCLFLA